MSKCLLITSQFAKAYTVNMKHLDVIILQCLNIKAILVGCLPVCEIEFSLLWVSVFIVEYERRID